MLGAPRPVRERGDEIGFVRERLPQTFVELGEPGDGRRIRDR
jgi:hypothetical protein